MNSQHLLIPSMLLRHALAAGVVIGALCIFWTVCFFALLFWAMCFGGGLGGPLAYPFGVIAFALTGLGGCLLLFLPCTVIAERIALHRGWPVIAQIPLCLFIHGSLCAGFALVPDFKNSYHLQITSFNFWGIFLPSLIPLGFYWWTAQFIPLLIAFMKRLGKKMR